MDKTNKQLLSSIFPTFGGLIGLALVAGTLRNLVPWVLGSGIFGATILALLTFVVGVILGIVIVRLAAGVLVKVWSTETTTQIETK